MRTSTSTLSGLAVTVALAIAGTAYAQSAPTAKAEAELALYTAAPSFTPPGAPFDAKSCMQGKKILSIPASSSIPFLSTIDASMARIAQQVGFEFKIWENQGQAAQWVQGIGYGTSNKYHLIDLLAGADPRAVVPQIKAARDAGAIVTASHLTGLEQAPPGGVSAVVPINYKKAGELLAQWSIAKTNGKTNALVLVVDGALSTDSMVAGLKQVFAACPQCKYKIVNFPIPDWAAKIQPRVQSAILADPSINYVIPIYDSMAQFVVPALTITGASSRVKIATFNGTPFAVDLVRTGKIEMDIGENLDWIAYGMLDAQMRLVCGLAPVADPKIPFLIFDKDNAATAGVPAQASKGYGDAYIQGFRTLWKLN